MISTPSSFLSHEKGLRFWRWLVWGWTLALTSMEGLLTIGFPHPPDGDSAFLLPQMLTFKKDGHLINTYFGVNYSPVHDGRFIWHGFLYQMVGGLIMPEANYEGLSLALFFMEAITLGLAAILLAQARPSIWSSAIARLILLLVLATWLYGSFGRPELLVYMWTMAGTLGYYLVKTLRARIAIAGVTIGLVAATSPIPSLFLLLLFWGISATKASWWPSLAQTALVGLLASVVFASTFLFYPYSFREWISGVTLHGRFSESPRQGEGILGFLSAWLVNFEASRPLILFWCCPPFVLSLSALWTRRAKWPLGLIFCLGISLLLIALVASDVRNYNVSCLLPVFFIPWLGWLDGDFPVELSHKLARKLPWLVIIAGLITALPLYREILIIPYLKEGMSRAEAIKLAGDIRTNHPQLEITGGLFSLFDDPTGLRVCSNPGEIHPTGGEVLLVQQINPYRAVPPEIAHYRLVRSYFGAFAPFRIAGIKIANSPRGYNFAVYERLPQ